jgi:dipeptidyl aminopeptidase/acylaminoacyl peptidase
MWVYRPRTPPPAGPDGAPGRAPVVVHLHGGPESQFRPDLAPSLQPYAAEFGFAVVAPNVRGSYGYGRTWLSLDDGPRREDSVRDVGAVLDWIAKQPDLDASRVVVVGGSYGGYMVLASMVHFADRIRAGVDVVGIANFVTFLERTADYRRDLRRAEYGDERDPEMREVLERISPLRRAGEIRGALLVVHGANDPRVPLHEAEQIVGAIRARGGTAWSVIADNEGHGFQKKSNRDYLDAVTATFVLSRCAGGA